jgi:hypothetical protein
LKLVRPDSAEVKSWREIVMKSNRAQSTKGAIDLALLDELQALLDSYRAGGGGAQPSAEDSGSDRP